MRTVISRDNKLCQMSPKIDQKYVICGKYLEKHENTEK